jgi:uncharacterized protein (TIGR00159 family)
MLGSPWAQFGWIDALDVLVVACVIYHLLLLFRGTRAMQMLLGLGLLYVAARVSLRAGLLTMTWILQNLLAAWVVLVVVVFQPELRRALASFGERSRFLRAFRRVEEAHLVEELVRGVASLAAQRIGGLVVLARETKLSDYVDAGVALDAAVSRKLLESIFQPGSPLHDGAIIVQNGRIAAASCYLPLTLNPQLAPELGTRHRAAIGLTEETDAVAIVVSEQTGAISLVEGGRITADLDAGGLRARLGEIVVPARRRWVPVGLGAASR